MATLFVFQFIILMAILVIVQGVVGGLFLAKDSVVSRLFLFCFVVVLLYQSEFLPWEIRVAFPPEESQLQQSRATQP